VISVDHITAHYFSFFVNRQEDGSFPKLVYSASGSHNSLAYFRAENDLMILNDNTYFDSDNKKYIGLGSIYNSLLRSLDILKEYQSPQEIPKVLTNIHRETEIDIINEFKKLYGSENTFDFEMYHWYIDCKKIMKRRKNIFSAEILFCSFERALFEILAEKFDRISDIMFI
jgi:tRNA A37 threonylcarbamoyltransferase TsaD